MNHRKTKTLSGDDMAVEVALAMTALSEEAKTAMAEVQKVAAATVEALKRQVQDLLPEVRAARAEVWESLTEMDRITRAILARADKSSRRVKIKVSFLAMLAWMITSVGNIVYWVWF